MTSNLQAFGRRTAVVIAVVAGVALAAQPAGAAVPEGWDKPDDIDTMHTLLLLGGVPLLLFVAIVVLTYLPALIKGERIKPGAPAVENQWLGGPRKSTGELAAPDSAESDAGGASARW